MSESAEGNEYRAGSELMTGEPKPGQVQVIGGRKFDVMIVPLDKWQEIQVKLKKLEMIEQLMSDEGPF